MVPAGGGGGSAEASCLDKCQKDQADAETSVVSFAAVKFHTEVLPRVKGVTPVIISRFYASVCPTVTVVDAGRRGALSNTA